MYIIRDPTAVECCLCAPSRGGHSSSCDSRQISVFFFYSFRSFNDSGNNPTTPPPKPSLRRTAATCARARRIYNRSSSTSPPPRPPRLLLLFRPRGFGTPYGRLYHRTIVFIFPLLLCSAHTFFTLTVRPSDP
uniref:Uncharacterized protein n=1 Tax=Sipha flava TaxID=143950 RepID=A0A2S2QYT3_9HEMI